MKKIYFLLLLSVLAPNLFAQSGRLRISFVGFDCYRETWDDILHSDGKGDEVYFNFGFSLADKNGNSKLAYEKRTPVYGDATKPAFNNRINVGSWVDVFGNNRGGIKAGDTYRCNDVVGEYDMANGDILTIIPTGWEHDPIADNSAAFMSTIRGFYNSINQKVAPIMIGFHALTGNLGGVIFNAGSLGISSIKAGGDQGELGRAGTRPLGMEKYGDFSPKLVVLNTPNLATICNSDMGFGRGIVAVNYDENAVGNARDHGNYIMLLKVEFFATSNPAPPPPPAPRNTGYTPPPPPPSSSTGNVPPPAIGSNMGMKKMNAPASNTIAGTWTGTWGSGENSGPNFYSFLLNADGSMKLVDAQNNITATGTYSFTNNQLTGSYTYTNGGVFSFAAALNNNQLSGTWGSRNSVTGGGKWIMSKAGKSLTGNLR